MEVSGQSHATFTLSLAHLAPRSTVTGVRSQGVNQPENETDLSRPYSLWLRTSEAVDCFETCITTADAHTSADSSRLNWSPCRFKWARPFRRKPKTGFWACAITFQTNSTSAPATCFLERTDTTLYAPKQQQLTPTSLLVLRYETKAMFLEREAAGMLATSIWPLSPLKYHAVGKRPVHTNAIKWRSGSDSQWCRNLTLRTYFGSSE
jgi:hypothetical protein